MTCCMSVTVEILWGYGMWWYLIERRPMVKKKIWRKEVRPEFTQFVSIFMTEVVAVSI
jgi:hypothetical protein